MDERRSTGLIVVALLALCVGVIAGWLAADRLGAPFSSVRKGGYQAVFLTNGQVFFGQVAHIRKNEVALREAHYIQARINPETKQQSNMLVRRGKEWHGPSEMVINAQHILWIEPVGAGSEVDKLMSALKAEK